MRVVGMISSYREGGLVRAAIWSLLGDGPPSLKQVAADVDDLDTGIGLQFADDRHGSCAMRHP